MVSSNTHHSPRATPPSTAWPAEKLAAYLAKAMPGAQIDVRDDTALHLGHNADVGHHGGHYRVRMVWAGFETMNRLARHKYVMKVLEPVWKGKHIHALILKLKAPGEKHS
jgi:BolA protein